MDRFQILGVLSLEVSWEWRQSEDDGDEVVVWHFRLLDRDWDHQGFRTVIGTYSGRNPREGMDYLSDVTLQRARDLGDLLCAPPSLQLLRFRDDCFPDEEFSTPDGSHWLQSYQREISGLAPRDTFSDD